jgi:integrase
VALAASQAHRGREGPLPGAASQAPGLEVGQEDPEARGKAKGVVVMARRATRGTGTVFFSKERRRWMAQLTVGHDPKTGRPKKLTRSFPTKREAEAWRQEMALKHFRGLLAPPEAITVRDFAQSWLERKAREVRPRTLFLYRKELAYALPSLEDPQAKDPLGSMRLQAVQPAHIRALLDGLAERGLSVRTVKKVREKLHALFEEALSLELVARNPVAPVKVKAPAPEKTGRALEPGEADALLEALDAYPDPRMGLALHLGLALGLRRVEILGLQWEDLDLEEGVLTIRRAWVAVEGRGEISDPKTPNAYRTLPIPHSTLVRLRAYRAWWEGTFGGLGTPWVFPGTKDPSWP